VIGDFGLGLLAAQVLASLAAMAGHNWSVFLKFRGGRGVATFFGGLIALSPVVALFGGQVFIIGAGLTRFASLGSIAGVIGTYTILIPLTIFNGFPLEYLVYALIGSTVIIIMHRDNIIRLIAGKERKLGEKVEKRDTPSPGESLG
jgi:glycerol-3-phosphate acyltransferase PlsY